MLWLFIYILAISLYDLRTRRIPNWYSLPLLVAGLLAKFPGSLDLWFACFVLVSAWSNGWMGAGDVKLWMAVLWALPNLSTLSLIPLIFISLLMTGLMQVIWRSIRKQPVIGTKTPAAWRTIPFLLMFWYAH